MNHLPLVNQYREALMHSGASPATIERKLASLRVYLSFLEKRGYLATGEAEERATPPQATYSTLSADQRRKLAALGIEVKPPEPGFFSQLLLVRLGRSIFLRVKHLRQSVPAWRYTLPYALKYQQPRWLIAYQKQPFARYLNFAFLIILCVGLGIGGYQQINKLTAKKGAVLGSAPVQMPQYLSFQGKLTDSFGDPISIPAHFRFGVYNSPTASGSAQLYEEAKWLTPDEDGVFNTLIGDTKTLPTSLFKDNTTLYLGITVNKNEEMTPRQQIATVAYAFNSQYLQGYGVNPEGAGSNEIPVIDGSGNIIIAAAGPSLKTTSGIFKIESPTLALMAAATSGNVGIGTTTAGSKMVVRGGMAIGSTTGTSPYLSASAPNGGLIVQGNVGIGTISPSQALEVQGNFKLNGALYDNFNSAGTGGMVLTSTGTGVSWGSASGLSAGDADTVDSLHASQFLRSDASTAYTTGTLTLNSGTTLDVNGDIKIADTDIVLDGASTNLTTTGDFSINGSQLLVSQASGNVGIGTTATSGYKLNINGQVNSAGFCLNGDCKTAWGSIGVGGSGTGNYLTRWLDSSTLTTSQIYDNGTSVGIGTASPTAGYLVDVSGNLRVGGTAALNQLSFSGALIDNGNSAGSSGFVLSSTGTGVSWGNLADMLSGAYESPLTFSNGLTRNANDIHLGGTLSELTAINQAGYNFGFQGGNVGIGTTNPSQLLEIVGNGYAGLKINNGTDSFVQQFHSLQNTFNIATSTNKDIKIFTNNATTAPNLYLKSGGNVGIGTTAPGRTLDIAGGTRTRAAQQWFNTDTAAYLQGRMSALNFIWDTSGTDRMAINSSGNVGIGTTNPTQKLDVNGNLNVGATAIFNTVNLNGTLMDSDNSAGTNGFVLSSTGTGVSWGNLADMLSGSYESPLTFNNGLTRTNNTIKWGGQLSELTKIDMNSNNIGFWGTGNIGIGTTSPKNKLDVSGSLSVGTFAGQATAPTNGMIISGNVGIGTTGPNTTLSVYNANSSTTLTNFTQSVSNAGINIATVYTANAYTPGLFWSTQNNSLTKPKAGIWLLEDGGGIDMYFGTSNSYSTGITNNGLVIDQSGNVGVGTTTPGSLLEVSGTGNVTSTITSSNLQTPSLILQRGTGTDAYIDWRISNNKDTGNLDFGNKSTGTESLKVSFNINGNVGIGTTIPAQKLDVNGNINVSGTSYLNSLKMNGSLSDFTGSPGGSGQVLTSTGVGVTWSSISALPIGDADTVDGKHSSDFLRSNASTAYTAGTLTLDPGTTLDVNGDISLADTDIILDGASTNLTTTGDFSINRSQFFINQASGNVGLGTSIPTQKLDIQGNINVGQTGIFNTLSLNGGLLDSGNNSGTNGFILSSTGTGVSWGSLTDMIAGVYESPLTFSNGLTRTANDIHLGGTLSELTAINQAGYDFGFQGGNVGIGTTIPSVGYLLDVNGNLKVGGTAYFASRVGIGTTSPATSLEILDTAEQLRLSYNPSAYASFTTDSNGNLTLNVSGSQINLSDHLAVTAGGAEIARSSSSTALAVTQSSTGNLLDLIDGSTTVFTVKDGGNVGIGTSSPQAKLQIYNSSTSYTNLQGGSLAVVSPNGSTPVLSITGLSTADLVNVLDGATEVFTILDGGNVGIGTTSPAQRLDVNGNLNVGATAILNTIDLNGTLMDSSNSPGAINMVLTSTGTGVSWGSLTSFSVGNADTVDNYHVSGNTNYLARYTNGTTLGYSTLLWDDGTNVGIGTTNPTQRLDINGNLRVGSTGIFNTLNLSGTLVDAGNSPGSSGLVLSSTGTGVSWGNPAAILSGQFEVPLTFNNGLTRTNNTIKLGGQLSELTAINQAGYNFGFQGGNVGVGTTNPTSGYILDVAGNVKVGGTAYFASYVGIGTTRPESKLHIAAGNVLIGNNQYYQGERADGVNLNILGIDTSNNIQLGSGSAQDIYFDTYNFDNAVVIKGTSGNVGIGTIAPSQKLDINGNLNVGATGIFGTIDLNGTLMDKGNSAGGLNMILTSVGTGVSWATLSSLPVGNADTVDTYHLSGNTNYLAKYTNGTTLGYSTLLWDDGTNVGIGTTAPSQKLDINGNLNVGNTAVLNTIDLNGTLMDKGNSVGANGFVLSSTGIGVSWGSLTDMLSGQYESPLTFNNGLTRTNNTIKLGGQLSELTAINQAGYNFGFQGGNVGVGTTNPRNRLDVNGSLAVGGYAGTAVAPANGVIISGNLGVGLTGPTAKLHLSASSASDYNFIKIENTTRDVGLKISTSGNIPTLQTYTPSSGASGWKMVLQPEGGNVGIGTTIPTQKLDVNGNLNVGATAIFNTIDLNGTLVDKGNSPGSPNFVLTSVGTGVSWGSLTAMLSGVYESPLTFGNGLTRTVNDIHLGGTLSEATTINQAGFNFGLQGGNVGIGTTNPTSKLTVVRAGTTQDTPIVNSDLMVYGDGSAYIGARDVTNDIEYAIGTSNYGGAFIGSMSNHNLWLRTNNTTRVTIDTSGKVGIGTSAPTALTHLSSTAAQDLFRVDDNGTGDTTPFVIDQNGNVGIGTASPAQKLDVQGNLNVGNTAIFSTIDLNGTLMDKGNSVGGSGFVLSSTGTGVSWGNLVDMLTGQFEVPLTFNNGLTRTGNTIRLGGQLSQLTSLDLNGNNFGFWGNGNVGIGTTSPTQKLDIQGNLNVGGTAILNTIDLNGTLMDKGNSPGSLNYILTSTSTGVSWANPAYITVGNADMVDNYHYNTLPYVNDAANATLTRSGSGPYTLGLNLNNSNVWTGAQILNANTFFGSSSTGVWGASGNVGIGTTTLATGYRLDVNGNVRVGGTAFFTQNVGIGITNPAEALDIAGALRLAQGSAPGTVADRLYNVGGTLYWNGTNLGTGTTYDARNGLTLSGGFFKLGGALSENTTITQGNFDSIFNLSGTGNFRVQDNGNDVFFVQNDGSVGIGTSTPTGALQVIGGDVRIGNGTFNNPSGSEDLYVTGNLEVDGTIYATNIAGVVNGSGTPNFLARFASPNTVGDASIFDNGNIGIGTTVPKNKVDISGSVGIGTYAGLITAPANGMIISGNVGIGTSVPTQKLDVNGNLNVGNTAVLNTIDLNGTLMDKGNSVGTNGFVLSSTGTGVSWGNLVAMLTGQFEVPLTFSNGLTRNINDIHLGGTLSELTAINQAGYNFGFQGGNVGIGTTIPKNKFDINGSVAIGTYAGQSSAQSNSLIVSGNVGIGTTNPTSALMVTGAGLFSNNLTTNGNFYVNSGLAYFGGNVGIGITVPTQKLDVQGNLNVGNTAIFSTIDLNGTLMDKGNYVGTNGFVLSSTGTGVSWGNLVSMLTGQFEVPLTFSNGLTRNINDIHLGGQLSELTKIDLNGSNFGFWGNGNVGIGTTSPTQKLDVNGNLNVGGSGIFQTVDLSNGQLLGFGGSPGASGLILTSTGTGVSWGDTLGLAVGNADTVDYYHLAGTTNFLARWIDGNNLGNSSIFDNGLNVGIGTSSPTSGYLLDVAGNLRVGGTGYFAGFVGIGTSSPTSVLTVQGTNSDATLGNELLTTQADRDFSSSSGNWSGVNWTIASNVATHTAGGNDFVHILTATAGKTYQIKATINTTTVGSLDVKFGGTYSSDVGQSIGTLTQHTWVIVATGTESLRFIPNTTWAGAIDDVTVKEITRSNSLITLNASNGIAELEIRPGGTGGENAFIGLYAGESNISGSYSTALGTGALRSNTTGSENTAIGNDALYSNTTGVYNTAIGEWALYSNSGGGTWTGSSFNNAIGSEALYYNSTGQENSAIGYDSLYYNTTGSYNLALGNYALMWNETGSKNVALGTDAALHQETGSNNVFIGYQAGYGSAGYSASGNILLGYQAGYYETGSNKLYIDNSNTRSPLIWGDFATDTLGINGNVGVGTTNPTQKLDVRGNINVGNTAVLNTIDLNGTLIDNGNSVGTNGYVLSSTGTGVSWGNPVAMLTGQFEVPLTFSNGLTRNTNDIHLGGTLSEATTINQAGFNFGLQGGNVGIGTTNPSAPLEIYKEGDLQPVLNVGTTGRAAQLKFSRGNLIDSYIGLSSDNNFDFFTKENIPIRFSQNSTVRLQIDTSGNVGIGTTNPTQKLFVAGNGLIQGTGGYDAYGEKAIMYLGDTNSGIAAENNFGLVLGVYAASGNGKLGTDSRDALVIRQDGNVGIGTSSPLSKLHLESSDVELRLTDTGDLTWGLATLGTGGSRRFSIKDDTNDSELLTVMQNGNVGIGNTNPQAKLDIAGATSTISNTSGDLTIDAASGNVSLNSDNLINVKDIYLNGNLGIGVTATGSYALYVKGNTYIEGNTTIVQDLRLNGGQILNPAGTASIMLSADPENSWHTLDGGAWQVTNGANYGQAALAVDQLMAGDIFTASSSGVPKFVIKNNGNLGVGTSNPSALTHIVQTVVADAFRVDDESNDLSPFVIDKSGNVGIGVSNTIFKMEIAASNTYTDPSAGYVHFLHLSNNDTTVSNMEGISFGSGPGDYRAGIVAYNIRPGLSGELGFFTKDDVFSGERLRISKVGNVGIGTTNPSTAKLDVAGSINFTGKLLEDGQEIFSGMIAPFAGSCPTGWTEYTAARGRTIVGTPSGGDIAATVGVGLGNTAPRTITDVPYHRHQTVRGSGTGGGAYFGTYQTSGAGNTYTNYTGVDEVDVSMPYIQLTYCQKSAGADLAEWIPASEDIKAETIISVDPNNKEKVVASRKAYDSTAVGIIATKPGWLMGDEKKGSVQMALAGRVNTRVSLKNGEIKPGDPITTSTIPGVGMKATQAGSIVGKAMEAFNESSSTYSCTDPETGRNEKCGTVLVFVNLSWADPANNAAASDTALAQAANAYYEDFAFDDNFEHGDLASIEYTYAPTQTDPNQTNKRGHILKTIVPSTQTFAGVISAQIGGPGELLRRERISNQIISETRIITSGKAQVRMNPNSLPISPGDGLASSDMPGMATKATRTGYILARALESWSPDSGKETIEANIGFSWFDPTADISDAGELTIVNPNATYSGTLAMDNLSLAQPELNQTFNLVDQFSKQIDRLGVFSELVAAKIKTGFIETTNLIADNVLVKQKLVAPSVETTELTADGAKLTKLNTDFIAPASDDVVINLAKPLPTASDSPTPSANFGRLLVKGEAGQDVFSLDAEGDANFSGNVGIGQTLSAQVIETNEIVAESARIKKLRAEQIEGLEAIFATMSANYITNTSSMYNNDNNISGLEEQVATPSGVIDLNNIVAGTNSAELAAAAENWLVTDPSNDVKIESNVSILGVTTLAQTIVSGPLTQDGTLIVDNGNSINVLGGTLYLQNQAGGGIDLLAGKVTIDTLGNAIFEGDLTVKGTLFAGVVKSSASDGNITFDLSSPTATDPSALVDASVGFGKILVKGSAGETVYSLDASGSAEFKGEVAAAGFKVTREAVAAEPNFYGVVEATASAGLTKIPAGSREVTIESPYINEKSLIYLTPIGSTANQVIYLARTNPDLKTFTAAIDRILTKDVLFSWWIVN